MQVARGAPVEQKEVIKFCIESYSQKLELFENGIVEEAESAIVYNGEDFEVENLKVVISKYSKVKSSKGSGRERFS